MNKSDLVQKIVEKTSLTRAQATESLDAITATIAETLASGSDVRLPGFGSFSVADRAATTARNPRTGETVAVPPSRAARFKPGSALKSALNPS